MLIELSNFAKIELKLTVLSRYSCPSDINSRILGFTPGIQAWFSRQFFPNPSREGSRFHYSTLLYKSLLRPLLYVKGIQDENEAPWCCVALIPLIPFTSRSQLNQVRAYCLSSPPYARRTPLTGPVLALILYLSDLLALRTLGTSPIHEATSRWLLSLLISKTFWKWEFYYCRDTHCISEVNTKPMKGFTTSRHYKHW